MIDSISRCCFRCFHSHHSNEEASDDSYVGMSRKNSSSANLDPSPPPEQEANQNPSNPLDLLGGPNPMYGSTTDDAQNQNYEASLIVESHTESSMSVSISTSYESARPGARSDLFLYDETELALQSNTNLSSPTKSYQSAYRSPSGHSLEEKE